VGAGMVQDDRNPAASPLHIEQNHQGYQRKTGHTALLLGYAYHCWQGFPCVGSRFFQNLEYSGELRTAS
jgi:hypothetical protein